MTGGALGVADTLAQSFYEERKRIRADNRKHSTNLEDKNKSVVLHCSKSDDQTIDIDSLDVIHILPKGKRHQNHATLDCINQWIYLLICSILFFFKLIIIKGEVGDLKCKYRAKEDDGTFEPLPYGHTVFLGDSIQGKLEKDKNLF